MTGFCTGRSKKFRLFFFGLVIAWFLSLGCARPNYQNRSVIPTQNDLMFIQGTGNKILPSLDSDHVLVLRWIHFPTSRTDLGTLECRVQKTDGSEVPGTLSVTKFFMPSMEDMLSDPIEVTQSGPFFRLEKIHFSMGPDWQIELSFLGTEGKMDHFVYLEPDVHL